MAGERAIVITGAVGSQAAAHLAKAHENELKKRYPAAFVRSACAIRAKDRNARTWIEAFGRGENRIFSIAEGGFLAALWNMAEETGSGLALELQKVPVLPQTTEVCEFLDLDPLALPSKGSLIVVTDEPLGLTAYLREHGVRAVIAGRLTEGNARILTNNGRIRYLDRP